MKCFPDNIAKESNKNASTKRCMAKREMTDSSMICSKMLHNIVFHFTGFIFFYISLDFLCNKIKHPHVYYTFVNGYFCNSEDLDKMPHYMVFHQDLHGLLR